MDIRKPKQGGALTGKGRHAAIWRERRESAGRDARQAAINAECVRDDRGVLVCPPKYAFGYGINPLKDGVL